MCSVYLECDVWLLVQLMWSDAGRARDGHMAMPAKPTSQLQLAVLPVLEGVAGSAVGHSPHVPSGAWNTGDVHSSAYVVPCIGAGAAVAGP